MTFSGSATEHRSLGAVRISVPEFYVLVAWAGLEEISKNKLTTISVLSTSRMALLWTLGGPEH